jgi:hypothetical protein
MIAMTTSSSTSADPFLSREWCASTVPFDVPLEHSSSACLLTVGMNPIPARCLARILSLPHQVFQRDQCMKLQCSYQRIAVVLPLALAAAMLCTSCYSLRRSSGGGQTKVLLPREVNPSAVAIPTGYRIEPVVTGLTFPTAVEFDEKGNIYLAEAGYSYGESWTTPRLLRVEANGSLTSVAMGTANGPWTGLAYHKGNFFVAEGGQAHGGRILRITPEGEITSILENLPGFGDHHSNGPIVSEDGWVIFGQGTASNSGVVGEDNASFGWIYRHPEFHDIPGGDVVLAGRNFESGNPLHPGSREKVVTGAFLPFGTPSTPGQKIQGRVPCSGSVMRVRPDGSQLELIAWGFRNPFGLAYAPDGRLFVSENAYDNRGSRPVWGAPDVLWHVEAGQWYGWPDYAAGTPLISRQFKPPGKPQPEYLLASHPGIPPKPAARLGVHAAACGLDFSPEPGFRLLRPGVRSVVRRYGAKGWQSALPGGV